MTIAYRLLLGGYVDETGPHRGVPPTEDDFTRIALMYAHRTLFERDLHAHLDMMSSDNAKKMYKEMEAVDVGSKYLFDPPETGKGKIEFQVHDPLPPQDVPNSMEFTQEMSVEEAKRRYPNANVSEKE